MRRIGYWYQNVDGTYPADCWKLIDGKWYHFNAGGYRDQNKWIGNYYVKADGVMATDEWVDGGKVNPQSHVPNNHTTFLR